MISGESIGQAMALTDPQKLKVFVEFLSIVKSVVVYRSSPSQKA